MRAGGSSGLKLGWLSDRPGSSVHVSLERAEVARLHRDAQRGNEGAIAAMAGLWEQYHDCVLVCFLCDREITEFPPFSEIFGDIADAAKAIAAPMCSSAASCCAASCESASARLGRPLVQLPLRFIPLGSALFELNVEGRR